LSFGRSGPEHLLVILDVNETGVQAVLRFLEA
jgi:hypothetical protein